jgi:uncharacterized membrane protein
MLWIWILLAIPALLLVAGPLRRRFLSAWRFTIPAVAGLVVGIVLAAFLVSFGLPAWTMLFLPCVFAMGIGSAGKQWLDENFGPPKGQK